MCLWIWRGRSLLCLLIFHSNYTGKNRHRWGLCPTTCWRISHTTCRHMHVLLNKSEVLTRRPFSKQLNTSCWNSYKHSGCTKVSNVSFKSKTQHEGLLPFFSLSIVSILLSFLTLVSTAGAVWPHLLFCFPPPPHFCYFSHQDLFCHLSLKSHIDPDHTCLQVER